MKKNCSTVLLSCLLLIYYSCAHTGSIKWIELPKVSRAEKEAILILPGFGSKLQGNLKQKEFFIQKGYDVFIPNYIGRKSIEQCLVNLDSFIAKNKIGEYKKVHVFSYIVGSWVLNKYIEKHPVNNIYSIVYDRSPLQERAPYVLVQDVPLLIRIASGKIMKDFSNTPYPSLSKGNIKTGILIESKPTKLLRKHKKTAMKLGKLKWDVQSLKQEYDDFLYTPLNHDEMYYRFDVIGDEIIYFFKNGKFSSGAKREPYPGDPFETEK